MGWADEHGTFAMIEQALTDAVNDAADAKAAEPLTHVALSLLRRRREYVSAAAPPIRQQAAATEQQWTLAAWLETLGINQLIVEALFPSPPDDDLAAARSLAAAVASPQAMLERLCSGGLLHRLPERLVSALATLAAADTVTNDDHDQQGKKFVQEGKAFTLQYGDLSTFFGGLEAKIGPPSSRVHSQMAIEHQAEDDSHDEFTTSNYGITTTPRKEWLFVAEPSRKQIEW